MVTSHFVQQKKVLKKEDIFGNICSLFKPDNQDLLCPQF